MITIYYKTIRDKRIRVKNEFSKNSWIHVESPSEAELEKLTQNFSLDDSLLHDAIDIYEVPRIEVEDGAIYIFTRFVYHTVDDVLSSPLLIILKKDFILTVSPTPFPLLHTLIKGRVDFTTAQKTKLLIEIFKQVNSSYYGHLNSISKRLRALSVRLENIKNRDILQFVNYENVLFDLNTALVRNQAIFDNLMSKKIITMNEDEKDILQDLSLESLQHIQITKESLRSIVNIREAYSTVMTNNLNQIIKLFTSLTVILTVPTIVGTFYGMNIRLPFAQSPLAFTFIVVTTLLIMGGLIFVFIRKDWL